MAKRRTVANPLALAVLAEMLVEPLHPYEMGRRLKEHGKDRNIKYNRSSLYMVVEQLVKAGFISQQETVRDTQRPERTVYAITDDGRREFFDWMRELVATPQQAYPPFGVALSLLSVLPPAEAGELLTARLAALGAEIDAIRAGITAATGDGLAWVFLVEEEYALALLEAEHRFVTGLISSLQEPDYVRAWHEIFGSMT
ncbi:DNA-binding PadR family transcriptional regulator [Allocatelliglobosispora scoriae]|uniref:DNA-binding PadR family transcriptional regulator n=1 Tax=Allocatelliglobosispora scoriae TaxID=643052 RepID=A0A841BIG9_9ACTN|nr:PadR family transcriptional regulator [Allocatelliglobosispora scoriae]MBB5868917.1 DNA-binding PadR family transcriptional regulator [Allocatelliglobosispora scoriae]